MEGVGLGDAFQVSLGRSVEAEFAGLVAGRLDVGRDQDLVALRLGGDARGQDHREAEEAVSVANRLPGVETDANANRLAGVLAVMGREAALDSDGAAQGLTRVGEAQQEAVALDLDLAALEPPELGADA